MPELPEVETVVRGLREKVVGRIIRKVNIYYENIIEYPFLMYFTHIGYVAFELKSLSFIIFALNWRKPYEKI